MRAFGVWRRFGALSVLPVSVLAAFCIVLPVSAASNPNGVAVIVGNAEYGHADIPNVAYAHRDASAFRRYVVDVLGFDPANIILLRNAKRADLLRTFGRGSETESDLWAKLLPDRKWDVVVYYSGHGVPGLNDGKGYLLPVDVPPRAAQEEGYPLDLLYKRLGSLAGARSVQVYLDACFSGASAGGPLVVGASAVYQSAVLPEGIDARVTAVSAAGADQVASWDKKAEHGLFTHHLLDALYGKGDADEDGKVTALEVKTYLDGYMSRAAWSEYGRTQKANILGASPRAVLASAPPEGFPERPALKGPEADADAADREKEDRAGEDETEAPAKQVPVAGPANVESGLGLMTGDRRSIQRGLSSLGFAPGPADGLFGRRTREAISSWQAAKGEEPTGYLAQAEAEALKAAGEEARRAAAERERQAHTAAEAQRRAKAEEARKARERQTRAGLRPGSEFDDCGGAGWCPRMVVVPAGSFTMGSPSSEDGRGGGESPQRVVTIPRPFAVGKYEVTRREFERFVEASGHSMGNSCWTFEFGEWEIRSGRNWRNPGFRQTDRDPVACVSWKDAKSYVRWLSRETGQEYRLLTESEWEYAARAGTRSSRHWGESCSYANGADRKAQETWNADWIVPCDDGFAYTAPVGSFGANGFGLHDMLGNVWEWIEDCWHDDYSGAPSDGSAWTSGGNCSERVVRGVSWNEYPRSFPYANRHGADTGGRASRLGFRISRTLTP